MWHEILSEENYASAISVKVYTTRKIDIIDGHNPLVMLKISH